jgi:hypothetical protein
MPDEPQVIASETVGNVSVTYVPTEKPIYKSGTAWTATLAATMMMFAESYNALPDKLIWPITLLALGLIVQRACADFGKHAPRAPQNLPNPGVVISTPAKPEIVVKKG